MGFLDGLAQGIGQIYKNYYSNMAQDILKDQMNKPQHSCLTISQITINDYDEEKYINQSFRLLFKDDNIK